MIRYVTGDLLESQAQVIAHQTNCKGVMGGGVALQIRERWPCVYDEYARLCSVSGHLLLGEVQIVNVGGDKYIANLFGQNGLKEGRQTNYEALYSALEDLRIHAVLRPLASIALPYKLGCGLAGGEWAIVKAMIETVFQDFEGSVEVFQLPDSL